MDEGGRVLAAFHVRKQRGQSYIKHASELYAVLENDFQDFLVIRFVDGIQTISGNTPLNFAASGGHTGVVELLLGEGALTGAIGEDGNTPLHGAARRGHSGAVEILLNNGASVQVLNDYGENPFATEYRRSVHSSNRAPLLRSSSTTPLCPFPAA